MYSWWLVDEDDNNFHIGRDDKRLYIDDIDVNEQMYDLINEFLNRVKNYCLVCVKSINRWT